MGGAAGRAQTVSGIAPEVNGWKMEMPTNGKLPFLSNCVSQRDRILEGEDFTLYYLHGFIGFCPLMPLPCWGGKCALYHLPASINRGPEADSGTENWLTGDCHQPVTHSICAGDENL